MKNTENTKKFADRLIDLIQTDKENNGTTIAKLSKTTGIPTGSLSKYQNDEAEPGLNALCKLADYFNVSVDYLIGREECITHENQSIHEMLGLSDGAITCLKRIVSNVKKYNKNCPEGCKKNSIEDIPFVYLLNFLIETNVTKPMPEDYRLHCKHDEKTKKELVEEYNTALSDYNMCRHAPPLLDYILDFFRIDPSCEDKLFFLSAWDFEAIDKKDFDYLAEEPNDDRYGFMKYFRASQIIEEMMIKEIIERLNKIKKVFRSMSPIDFVYTNADNERHTKNGNSAETE